MRYLIVLLLSGCALEPNALRVEGSHTSHLFQHFDGTPEVDRHCYDMVGVAAHWQKRGAYFDAGEYYSPDGLDNRHEVFEAKLGYEWKLHD